MTARIPLFPLGSVLFPGLVLPLHIFEERYRTLIRELVAQPDPDEQFFGVVAIRRGWEVEQPDPAALANPPEVAATSTPQLYEVGCTAQLRQVTERDDGGFDVVTVGQRRFRLISTDTTSAPYLIGEVEWLPPEEADDTAHQLGRLVLAAFRDYLNFLQPNSELPQLMPTDPTVLSHLVAAGAHLTVADRQALLAAGRTADRLRHELRLLRREMSLLREVRAVPAPLSELAQPSSPN